jgi:FAD/FMN-containing dehydrogenase
VDLQVTTSGGAASALEESVVRAFGARLRGELLQAGDEGYEEARKVWNGMIDRRPALIACASSVADVINSVNFARENDLLVAVRGGGHNVAGTGTVDGGLLIDLSRMKGIKIDPERRTAHVEPGVTIGELDKKTQAFSLAVPLGVVSETGIAGLTLGGGLGWLRRKHGLSSDNLLSVDLVTPDGKFVSASEEVNQDLLWGIKGGGGNFGIVTCFEYGLHAVGPEVMFAFVFYPGEQAREILRSVNEYMAQAPDEVSPLAFLGRVPHDETFPEERQGEPFIAVAAMFAGEVEEGEKVLRPLRELAVPIVDFSATMPYVEAQKVLDEDYPAGGRYYWKSQNVNDLGDETIAYLIEHAEAAPSDHSTIDIWYQGGAMARVGASESAFGDRSAPILLGIEANWDEPRDDEANVEWARGVVASMRRFSSGGAYLNFPGFMEEGQRLMRDSYGENYGRLVELKDEYDPDNLFRLNQNIRPTADGSVEHPVTGGGAA